MAFTVYPAIDIKDGKVVRLTQGAFASAETFSASPADMARQFADAGARWVHVVDLDGARAGTPVCLQTIEKIRATTGLDIQYGGGLRTHASLKAAFDAGVTRAILGTVAVRDPSFVARACADYHQRIGVGIDAKDGMVATHGWESTSTNKATDFARAMEKAGVCAVAFTDIARDGTLSGVNIDATKAVAAAMTNTPVIASGGVAGLDDIRTLAALGNRVSGVILGKAYYKGLLSLADALRFDAP